MRRVAAAAPWKIGVETPDLPVYATGITVFDLPQFFVDRKYWVY
ncbi:MULTISPECIES: hypothetical protein [unclassified Massilia]|nr:MULTISPECIES: hypothetical protein [unclassified Massilia]